MYPQFSYLLKLKLQLSDGPLNDNVFNIPIYIPKIALKEASYGYFFEKIELNSPGAAFHEMIHTLGSAHLIMVLTNIIRSKRFGGDLGYR
jgi:hypothetical protein